MKKSVTYRIDENLYNRFNEAVKKLGLKKTFVIEKSIEKFVEKTLGKCKK